MAKRPRKTTPKAARKTTKPNAATAPKDPPRRPRGAAITPIVRPGRCTAPNCDATAHGPYTELITRFLTGEIDGRKYNRITWKRTQCSVCGHPRVDVFHAYKPEKGRS